MTRPGAGLLAAGLLLVATGCAVGTDDEMEPRPTRTVTASPTQSVAPAPESVPVGDGEVVPTDVVWAQGSVLHVGDREVDLAPIDVEAFVVVEGGVFVLSAGELWFTDLARVKGTAQTAVTGLQVSADAGLIRVADTRSGRELTQGYDTRTGQAVRGEVETQTPDERRQGPGKFQVRTSGAGGTSVVDLETGQPVSVAGLPPTLEVGEWVGESLFFGVADGAGPRRFVVSCDLVVRRCVREGVARGSEPVVFGIGQ